MSKLLQFTRYKTFDIWDVKRNLSSLIYSDYDIVTLGHYIKEEKTKVKPFENPENDFKILGVSNKVGIFDNEIKKGKEINQAYKVVENGFLAFNPYRINVGSIGIKSNKHKYNLISPAYVVFSCNDKLLPEYLFLLFKTNTFNQIIKNSTKGSVRQILSYDILETLKIPLPPIEIQLKILEIYNNKLNLSSQQLETIDKKEQEIEEFLYKELDIKILDNKNNDMLNLVRFKNLERWDAQSNAFNIDQIKSKYEFIKVKKLVESSQYGLSEKADLDTTKTPMLRMNNILNGELDIASLKYIKLPKTKLESYKLEKDDVLFNRTNSKELVGKSAVFKLNKTYTFASYLIRIKLNFDLIEPNYFVQIINSFIGRKQIDAISRQITGQVNINAEELKNFVIPNPPLKVQEEISKYILKLKNEINDLKLQSFENKSLALKEFEMKVFNES